MGSISNEHLPLTPPSIHLHGRDYKLPTQPTVIVCIDGFDPTYLSTGISANILPNLSSFVSTGFHTPSYSAMPSLTNPNNVSIITGAPTATHGIAGNFYLDKATGEEHMILDDSLLRGDTILQLMAEQGVRVAAVTAKDKLRKIINHGLGPAIKRGKAVCFSAQDADSCTLVENGIEDVVSWLGWKTKPSQYSGDLSIFVLDAGIKLLEEWTNQAQAAGEGAERAELMYLTLSDYVQHKYAPGSPESDDFLKKVDERLGKLVELGAVVAVTGDHGMSDKCLDLEDGKWKANVLFLEDALLTTCDGKWKTWQPRVVCPISDPFVRHHGALGGFVRVHLLGHGEEKSSVAQRGKDVDEMLGFIRELPQVECAYNGEEAAKLFEMPADREGDMVVISKKNAVVGSREVEHDLSALEGHRLRSHGGLSEQVIPLIKSVPVKVGQGDGEERKMPERWRNFDIFDLALNW